MYMTPLDLSTPKVYNPTKNEENLFCLLKNFSDFPSPILTAFKLEADSKH